VPIGKRNGRTGRFQQAAQIASADAIPPSDPRPRGVHSDPTLTSAVADFSGEFKTRKASLNGR
jgi:hypothetical protein